MFIFEPCVFFWATRKGCATGGPQLGAYSLEGYSLEGYSLPTDFGAELETYSLDWGPRVWDL